jgi:Zn-dependent peptidase ImmA (M78 family)
MTYIPEARIEARAAELWRAHKLTPGFDIEHLLDHLGLGLVWEEIDESGDDERVLGQLIPAKRLIVLNERHIEALEDRGGRLRRFTLGHELGHWLLHSSAARLRSLSLFDGERIWCRDGSPDPIERQAEMFSAALLIPAQALRVALPTPPWEGWPTVYRLSDAFGVNVTPMAIRLERLGWMHRNEKDLPVCGQTSGPGQDSLF